MASNDIMMRVGADVSRAVANLNRVSSAAQKMGDTGGKSSNRFTGKLNTLSAGLKRTSARMSPLSAIAGGLFVRGIKSSAEFSQKMARVGAIAGANKKQMGQLENAAMKWGSSSIYSINEVADGMQGLAEQGYSTKEIIKAMPAALNLAQGSAAKLADSTMLLATATNVYGKGTYSMTHLSNVFTKSANTSAASVKYLQTAFQYSAQPAKALGVGIEDLTAATGILANKGQRASSAGTMMGQVFARLASPTAAGQQALDQLGISAFDSQGKFVGLSKFVGMYADATKGMSKQQKLATAKVIFGQRPMSAWMDLVDAGAGKIDKYSDSLKHSGGAAQKAADKANNNLGAALDNLKDSFQVLDNKLMKSVDGPLRKLIKWLDDMVDKMANMDSSKLQAIVLAIGAIAALAPLLGILAMIVDGISAIVTIAQFAAPIISALWVALTAPVTLIIGAITAVVVALTYFFTQTKTGKKLWANFMEWLQNLWEGFVNFIKNIASAVGEAWSNALDALKNAWQGIKDWFAELWQGVVDVFTNAWNTVVQDVQAVIQGIEDAWNATIEFFTTLWQGIVEVAKTIWQGLVEFFTGLIEGVVNIWNTLVEFFTNLWNSILEVTSNVWNTITTTLTTIIQTIFEFISNIFTSIGDFISNVWNTIVTVTTTIWNTIATAVTTGATNAWNWLVNVWNAIPAWVSGLWNGVVSLVTNLWNAISSAVSNGANTAWNWLKKVWNSIPSWVSSIWNSAKGVVSKLWNSISSAVSNGAKTAFNWLKNVWSGITGWVSNLWNRVRNAVANVWGNISRAVSNGAHNALNWLHSAWGGITGWVSSLWNGVRNTVANVWSGISSTVSNMAHRAISGLYAAWGNITGWVGSIWSGVKSVIFGYLNFDLSAAGHNIMISFYNGLVSAFNSVKSFISGIGSWIKKHKGPLPYDRRLLIPAGKAIMRGFDEGLNNQYKSVMRTVSGVAGDIEDAMNLSPTIDLGTGVSDVRSQLGVDVANEVAVQPANIKLNLGSTSYEAFVNDISQQQGRSARLKKSNTVR